MKTENSPEWFKLYGDNDISVKLNEGLLFDSFIPARLAVNYRPPLGVVQNTSQVQEFPCKMTQQPLSTRNVEGNRKMNFVRWLLLIMFVDQNLFRPNISGWSDNYW